MDYRDNRQRWAESHQVVHFYAGQWCTFTPALTFEPEKWRKLFGPFDIDLDVGDLLDELGRRQESVETVEPNTAVESEPNTAVESASNSGDQNDTGASSKRD